MKKNDSYEIFEYHFGDLKNKQLKVTYLFMDYKNDKVDDSHIIKEIALTSLRAALENIDSIEKIDNYYNYKITISNSVISFNVSHEINAENENLWQVELVSEFQTLVNYRSQFLKEMLNYFNIRYCLKDEISTEITIKAYPYVSKLENLLREYLLKFFVKKVGSKWWHYNSSERLKKKSTQKSETRAFKSLLNMEIYNVDFVDLKELVTGNFPKLSSDEINEALNNIIKNIEDDPEKAIIKTKNLQLNYMGNWEKFFAEHIEIHNFKSIWDNLYEIRCIVSHNSLITLKNFTDLIDYYNKLQPKLIQIINELSKISLSEEEQKQISELNKKLDEIQNISVNLFKSDITEILTNSSLTIAAANLKVPIREKSQFRDFIDQLSTEFSLIGINFESHIYSEDDAIPISCWIKIGEIDGQTRKALEYGNNAAIFS